MDTSEQGSSDDQQRSDAQDVSGDQQPTIARSSNGQALTMDQAAAALGVSLMTVRRRVKSGALHAYRVPGKFGPEWRVHLEAPAMLSGDHHTNGAQSSRRADARTSAHQRGANGAQAIGQGSVPSVDRAMIAALREAQNTTAGLIAENKRLNDERAELYGRLGFLQAQLQAKDEQVKALMAPAEPPEPEPAAENIGGTATSIAPRWPEEPSPAEPPRPWWRFW